MICEVIIEARPAATRQNALRIIITNEINKSLKAKVRSRWMQVQWASCKVEKGNGRNRSLN